MTLIDDFHRSPSQKYFLKCHYNYAYFQKKKLEKICLKKIQILIP
jgi:hypothetical protein